MFSAFSKCTIQTILLLSQVDSWNIKLNEHYVTMIPTCNLNIKSIETKKEEFFLPSFF